MIGPAGWVLALVGCSGEDATVPAGSVRIAITSRGEGEIEPCG